MIVATINIILLAIGGDPVDAAFYCFSFSVLFLIGSIFALIYLMRTPLYQQCIEGRSANNDCENEPDENTQLVTNQTEQEDNVDKTVYVSLVLRKIKIEATTVFIIYIVTLGLFPAVTVLVESTNSSSGGDWELKYFVPVACFLIYNIGDYLGRLLVGTNLAPKICSKFALVLSILRIVFIPLMLFCNIAPSQRHFISVHFPSDTVYIILVLVMAVTNGYLTSIVMVNAPGRVLDFEQQTASNLMVGLLGLGLISGAVLSAGLINVL